MIDIKQHISFDKVHATIPNCPVVERRLSQLNGVFADVAAYSRMVEEENDPLVYSVSSVELANGDGDLHYGIGKIMPGSVGQEYFLTRGHLHQSRACAEVYIGLTGTGVMLLENELSQSIYSVDLLPDSIVYVPGHTAHRTVNIGDTPLTYLGIYPARAGHDYTALAERNFAQVVVQMNGKPIIMDRQQFVGSLISSR